MPVNEANPSPSEVGGNVTAGLTRRSVFRGAVGAVGLAMLPSLAACNKEKTSGAKQGERTVAIGSYYSDPSTKGAFASLTQAVTKATGVKTVANTTTQATFNSNINNYLQGTPDDLATWFAGFRMQYLAAQGLLAPVDDVWEKIGANYTQAGRDLSKGLDGRQYIVPIYNYPWVVYYSKSLFASKGYSVPTKWNDFIALATRMKRDGLIPLAFGNQDVWPAAGTFDILDLRINGYEFHMKLMRHEVPYTDSRITRVFEKFAELLPYMQSGANGRIWQDAAKALEHKQAGMMFQGSNQVVANYSDKNRADLDFFVYPEINPEHGQYYMDAPADGICLPKRSKDQEAAKKVLEYVGTGPGALAYLETDQWDVSLIKDLNVPTYNTLQKKSALAIGACKNVAQYLDRDTDPAMATAFMALIQKFIADPSTSKIKSIQASAEAQAKIIFVS